MMPWLRKSNDNRGKKSKQKEDGAMKSIEK